MANFFTKSYTKEGKGVSKSGQEKKRIFLFFELAARKFGRIILVGLLFFLFCLPIVTFGPACCGVTLVMRNFARSEHAFIWSDFWRGFKENFKQGFVLGLLNLVALAATGYATWYYFNVMMGETGLTVSMILFVIMLLCLILEIFMMFYLYQMIVTFTLSNVQLLKNAFFLSMLGVRVNLLTLVSLIAMIALSFFLFTIFPAMLLLIPVFILPMMLFLIVFNAYGPVKKYLIDPQLAKEAAEAGEIEEDEVIFSDEIL